MNTTFQADVAVVGAGLAALVAATEVVKAGRTVVVVEQEPAASLGGQAFWSLGGLFLVDSPEQRRLGIRDSLALAREDWEHTAGFSGDQDAWPRRWAEAYLEFAAGEKRKWLRQLGIGLFPVVGWAERRATETGPGNSVPRFHIAWGTGPAVVEPFIQAVQLAAQEGKATLLFRHRVDEVVVSGGAVTGVRGSILEESEAGRGEASSRLAVGTFAIQANAVIVASGGIGGDLDRVRRGWPPTLRAPPNDVLTGVPAHVDGRMLDIVGSVGGHVANGARMWHYTEGIKNWNPVWPNHGIRILPGPSSLWVDASGRRLPAPLFPGSDTLGTLAHLRTTGFDHSWLVLNQAIIKREFALSGSEQNPDFTGKSLRLLAQRMLARTRAPGPVEAFKDAGIDFVVAGSLPQLLDGMDRLIAEHAVDHQSLTTAIDVRDGAVAEGRADHQFEAIRRARRYRSERWSRVAKPGRLLDPSDGPLIAVRVRTLTRKTLGGVQTDLDSRVLDRAGAPMPGLFAAGEVAGFGGGGMHGFRALEGTFLGGCLFSGRIAGRSAAT